MPKTQKQQMPGEYEPIFFPEAVEQSLRKIGLETELIQQCDLVSEEAAKHQLPQNLVFRINLMRAVADELAGRTARKPLPVNKLTP